MKQNRNIFANDKTCIRCGLPLILAKKITHDHFPIPRSKGGKETHLAHYYCDHAAGNVSKEVWEKRGYELLKKLIESWKMHHKNIPRGVYESLRALKERQKA